MRKTRLVPVAPEYPDTSVMFPAVMLVVSFLVVADGVATFGF